jgi:hypothetical protein
VDCDPVVALDPDQAPEAVHEVALLDDQVSIDALPLARVLGLALKLTAAVGFTVTVADCAALPPGPVQLRLYVALAVSAPVDCEPLTA